MNEQSQLFRYACEPASWMLVNDAGEVLPYIKVSCPATHLDHSKLALSFHRELEIDQDNDGAQELRQAIANEQDDFQIIFGDTQKVSPEMRAALKGVGIPGDEAVAWRAAPPVWHIITRGAGMRGNANT